MIFGGRKGIVRAVQVSVVVKVMIAELEVGGLRSQERQEEDW